MELCGRTPNPCCCLCFSLRWSLMRRSSVRRSATPSRTSMESGTSTLHLTPPSFSSSPFHSPPSLPNLLCCWHLGAECYPGIIFKWSPVYGGRFMAFPCGFCLFSIPADMPPSLNPARMSQPTLSPVSTWMLCLCKLNHLMRPKRKKKIFTRCQNAF